MMDNDVDLFLQFLYELGFFHSTDCGDSYLCLAIPNNVVNTEIVSYLCRNNVMKNYYNHSPKLISEFTKSNFFFVSTYFTVHGVSGHKYNYGFIDDYR